MHQILPNTLAKFTFRLAALFLVAASPIKAQENWVPGHPYRVVETGKRYNRLQDAINDIGAGHGSIRIDPGRWDDCGVQKEGNVSFEAVIPGKTFFYGPRVCEAKAELVLRGQSSRVIGIVFSNVHVNDGNGAGIRLEKGSLYAAQNWFRDSDEGILANDDPVASIIIDKSTFTRIGRCGGYAACAHSIYVGDYGSVTVTHSRFEQGRGGHYLKSRAARIDVEGNLFDDTGGTATNYMIDLSNGATGRITNNWFLQGAHKENATTMIAIAAEGRRLTSQGLVIEGNVARLEPGARPTSFVADWAGDPINLGPNRLDTNISRYLRK